MGRGEEGREKKGGDEWLERREKNSRGLANWCEDVLHSLRCSWAMVVHLCDSSNS